MLPTAGAITVIAPFSTVLVRAFGTKLTVAGGLLVIGAAARLAANEPFELCRAGSVSSFTAKPNGSRQSRLTPPSGLIVHGVAQANGPWLASSPLACR
jgi:hypothetical protein